jgi:hypothetical protein
MGLPGAIPLAIKNSPTASANVCVNLLCQKTAKDAIKSVFSARAPQSRQKQTTIRS